MPWGAIEKVRYPKHFPLPGHGRQELVEATKNEEAARYFIGESEIKILEEFVVEHNIVGGFPDLINGRKIRLLNDFRDVYMICDRIIGASEGMETDIVRVEWTENQGFLHGKPVTDRELREDLRRAKNFDELRYYKNARKQIRRGENVNQLVKYPPQLRGEL